MFNRLTVIGLHSCKNSQSYWLCRCLCGNETVVQGYAITSGRTISCGCAWTEAIIKSNRRHGLTNSRAHIIWGMMFARCENPNTPAYPDYGGRGIKICERWHVFENFLEDMGHPPDGQTIERNDVNGNYEPTNCRWATRWEQCQNKRNTIKVTIGVETKSMGAWCKQFNIPRMTAMKRRARGVPQELWFSHEPISRTQRTTSP